MGEILKISIKLLSYFIVFNALLATSELISCMHTVFAPGVSSSLKRVNDYAQAGAFASAKYSTIIFPDQKRPKKLIDRLIYRIAQKKNKAINRSKIVLSSGHDIKAVKKVVDQAKSQDPKSNGILFGTCRGASAIIQYLAQHDSNWVKGIVLDSPFADPNVLLQDRTSPILVKMFLPNFNKNAATPLDGIKRIKNKKIKILILFAKGDYLKGGQVVEDMVTPYNKHIKPLYDEFRKYGFDVTITGYNADHCGGIDGKEKKGDRKAYTKKLHEWYKKHGFTEQLNHTL